MQRCAKKILSRACSMVLACLVASGTPGQSWTFADFVHASQAPSFEIRAEERTFKGL